LFAKEQVESKPPPAEEEDRQRNDPDPKYCQPRGDKASPNAWPNADDIKVAIEQKPRYILGFPAALFLFEGNVEAANAVTNSAYHRDEQTKDINLIAGRADALYLGGQDLREVILVLQTGLQMVEDRIVLVERAKAWSQETDNKIRNDLVTRYRRARFLDRLELAYISAQHGLAAEENRDVNWWSALQYAEEAYKALLDPTQGPTRFVCIDHGWDLKIKDKYAFVKLAYQAYTLRTEKKPPDESQVRQARSVLDDALAQARQEHRRLAEAQEYRRRAEAKPSMAQGGPAPSCFTESETRAWIKQILSHLKLADALRP
jgi:hypothetical protein